MAMRTRHRYALVAALLGAGSGPGHRQCRAAVPGPLPRPVAGPELEAYPQEQETSCHETMAYLA
jgi:hypothetical protein